MITPRPQPHSGSGPPSSIAAFALCAALLWAAAGCGARPVQSPLRPRLAAAAAAPASGAPGAKVAITGRVVGSHRPATALVCWVRCGRGGVEEQVPVLWSATAGRFSLTAQVPAFAWDGARVRLLAAGPVAVGIACLVASGSACAAHPDGSVNFQVTAQARAVLWWRLPAGRAPWSPVSPPVDPPPMALATGNKALRIASCATTSRGLPYIKVTSDLGRSWGTVRLPAHELGVGPANTIGCQSLSPDPTNAEAFYVSGVPDPHSAQVGLASPPPLYTTDGGKTWQFVPVPPGFSAVEGFTGFTSSTTGVVAWYSRAYFGQALLPELFSEEVALHGGADWVQIPLVCPTAPPCVWRAAGLNPSVNGGPQLDGLVHSADRGKSWAWSTFAGMALSGGGAVQAGSDLLWTAPTSWAAGTEGAPGAGLVAPLLYSPDGGAGWYWVEVPAPPSGWTAAGPVPPGRHLWALPDGDLLLQVWGGNPSGWLLAPGAHHWCPLSGPVPGHGAFLTVGKDLVWLDGSSVRAEASTSLHCGA